MKRKKTYLWPKNRPRRLFKLNVFLVAYAFHPCPLLVVPSCVCCRHRRFCHFVVPIVPLPVYAMPSLHLWCSVGAVVGAGRCWVVIPVVGPWCWS